MTICIDEKLFNIFEGYMEEIGNKNKTKYIEKLIREDLISRNMIKNNLDILFLNIYELVLLLPHHPLHQSLQQLLYTY